MAAKDHQGGKKWTTRQRHGETHASAGRLGGSVRGKWRAPLSPGTKAEIGMRWHMRESTQRELATEYGVSRSTVQNCCRQFEEGEP